MDKKWISPTYGQMDIQDVFISLADFIKQKPHKEYTVVVGSDSQPNYKYQDTTYITAIVIHRVGECARYFYHRQREAGLQMQNRIYREATDSIEVAGRLVNFLSEIDVDRNFNIKLEVHQDVGKKGATKDLVKNVVGMISGSGFDAKIKPESWGASCVADKHTKAGSH